MDAALRDVTRAISDWLDEPRPVALATVVASDGSAPRGLGARLAIAGPQEWIGALSGGCTEAAVIDEAMRLLEAGDPDHAVFVAYTKETMADVGPVCGATLGVVVELVDDVLAGTLERLVDTAGGGAAAELAITYAFPEAAPAGELLVANQSTPLVREAVALDPVDGREPAQVTVVRDDVGIVVRQRVPAAPHLVLGGAGDITRELVLLAQRLAWRTTVIDPRTTILQQLLRACTPDRAIDAWTDDAAWDELHVGADTACVALAHEAHHDEPFLARALASDAAYVGAVGSRRVQQDRRAALAGLGLSEDAIARLHGPAGLDLGGSSASEVAVAIAAEVVAVLHGRAGGPLTSTDGPIRA